MESWFCKQVARMRSNSEILSRDHCVQYFSATDRLRSVVISLVNVNSMKVILASIEVYRYCVQNWLAPRQSNIFGGTVEGNSC